MGYRGEGEGSGGRIGMEGWQGMGRKESLAGKEQKKGVYHGEDRREKLARKRTGEEDSEENKIKFTFCLAPNTYKGFYCLYFSLFFFICLFFVSSGNEMQFFPSRGKCEVRMK